MSVLTMPRTSERRPDTSGTKEPPDDTLNRVLVLRDDDLVSHNIVTDFADTFGTAESTDANANVATITTSVMEAPKVHRLVMPQDPENTLTRGPWSEFYDLVSEYLGRVWALPSRPVRQVAQPTISDLGVEERPFVHIEAPIKRKYRVTVVGRARAEYRAGYKFPDASK